MSRRFNECRLAAIAAASLAGACSSPALADIYVIVNSTLTVAAGDIRAIYTGEKELAGSVRIRPLDNHAAESEFLSKVLLLNAGRYESLWVKKCFRDGMLPPAVKATDEEVIAYVKSTPGAIGYVMTAPPAGVVVLEKF
jgi:hypothetical protein